MKIWITTVHAKPNLVITKFHEIRGPLALPHVIKKSLSDVTADAISDISHSAGALVFQTNASRKV